MSGPVTAAVGFVATVAQLKKLAELATADNVEGFWDALHKQARRLSPDFPHPGYVISVLLEYLEEQGLHVVSSFPGPEADQILDASLGLQFSLNRAEAKVLTGALSEIHPSERELGEFYEEFSEEPLANAGRALVEGVDFLIRLLNSLRDDDERLLLFVG
jgi:hypothetical protein